MVPIRPFFGSLLKLTRVGGPETMSVLCSVDIRSLIPPAFILPICGFYIHSSEFLLSVLDQTHLCVEDSVVPHCPKCHLFLSYKNVVWDCNVDFCSGCCTFVYVRLAIGLLFSGGPDLLTFVFCTGTLFVGLRKESCPSTSYRPKVIRSGNLWKRIPVGKGDGVTSSRVGKTEVFYQGLRRA
jgi:hypothetical protein